MDFRKVHQGQFRQGGMTEDEIKAAEDAGQVPGINPDIHAPEVVSPGDEPELNLHGDVDGSPYSANPGEISLAEADEKAKQDDSSPAADAAGTRAIEVESRRTAVPTETIAAEDEADDPKAKPKAGKK